MSLEFNVLIIGGGVVGLTAALAMAQRGFTVAVIDAGPLQAESAGEHSRVYAINQASQHVLHQLSVWEHLKECAPYRSMYVWDALNGAHIDFDSRYVAAQTLGFIVEEFMLKEALLQQISQYSSIHLIPKWCVEEVLEESDGIRVCANQHSVKGQLLMIADGAHSKAREQLKVDLTSWSYDQHALVAKVSVEKTHQQTAYQIFRPDGPLAFLPLSNSHECSIVWSTDSLHAKKLMDYSAKTFNELITEAFEHKLGKVELLSKRHQFPLKMRHVRHYTGAHWMLLGDAAHTIHPLAGLGLNVGLADVASWMQCLDRAHNLLLSKKALRAYQRERKHAVWQTILLMEGFKQLFGTSLAPLVSLRGWGLTLCNQLIPIKRLFIEHARGGSSNMM